jgi:hypothetical protein
MESRDLLKSRIREGLEEYDRNVILVGLLNKSLDRFKDAFRLLETAIQHSDDQELRTKLEAIKLKVGHDIEVSGDFDVTKPTILSAMVDIVKAYKP